MLGLSYYHAQIAIAHFICCLIAGLTVCTRLYAKLSTKQGLRRDDYLIVWTLIVYWAAIIVALHESFTNFGPYTKTEILNMHLTAASPRLIQYRKAMLTAFLLGIWSQFTCKLSILLFYRRIFRTCTFHQRASLYLIIFTSLWWATAVAAMIFVCRSFVVSSHTPSEAVKVAAERGKWSGKWQQVFQAFLALDPANDLAILLVPIRTAFTLQMARRAKVELVGVFALGGFVVVTNVVRIVEFYTRRKEDPNEIFYHATELWTSIHVCTAVLCACLPILKPLWTSVSTKVRTKVTGINRSSKQQGSTQGSEAAVLNQEIQDWNAIKKTVTVHQTSAEA